MSKPFGISPASEAFEESLDENLAPELQKIKSNGPKIESELEELAMKYQELQTEHLIIRRQLPNLQNAEGKNVTNEFVALNEKLDRYKRENEKLQARLAEYEKNPRYSAMLHQSGDSIVSEFSMDRNAAQRLKDVDTPLAQPQAALIDYEKEELLEKVKTLEEKNELQKVDLNKCYKLINGLRKLVPEELDGTKINWTEVDFDNKDIWLKKLYSDLRAIDKDWNTNAELVRAINNFLNPDLTGRPSVVIEQLADERNKLKKLMEASDFERTYDANDTSFQPRIVGNTSVAIDLIMNGSLCPDDLSAMKSTFAGFRKLCTQMFQQLQNTASFLEKLIRSLEDEEDESAKKLLEKIRSIHLNLNTSMQDASVMIDDAQKAEESICAAIEKSIRLSMAPGSETLQLTARLAQMENDYAQASEKITTLETNLTHKDQEVGAASLKLEELKKIVADKQQIIEALEKKVKALNDEKNSVLSAKKAPVPEILEEMSNIYSTLNSVSEEVKLLSNKSKPKSGAKK